VNHANNEMLALLALVSQKPNYTAGADFKVDPAASALDLKEASGSAIPIPVGPGAPVSAATSPRVIIPMVATRNDNIVEQSPASKPHDMSLTPMGIRAADLNGEQLLAMIKQHITSEINRAITELTKVIAPET
jgi:hypothetical protein